MAQRRFHYEQAFEQYLRDRGAPYIAVDEAKRALQGRTAPVRLKSFDFVVYTEQGPNVLVDVKGRKIPRGGRSLQNWVTADDVEHLGAWEQLFGQGFTGAFAFLYWCDAEPPAPLFHDVFERNGRWYAAMLIRLADYRRHMRPRSASWGTVGIPAAVFNDLARPLCETLSPHCPVG